MAYNETAYKASQKYKASNIKRVPLDVQKEHYDRIKNHAEGRGETVNGFIKRAIDSQIERDNSTASTAAEQSTDAVTSEKEEAKHGIT